MKYLTKRQQLDMIQKQIEIERSSFVSHWQELADYVSPRRNRYDLSDTNRGDKMNQKIIDSTATIALRTLRSGMMSGITSPARPWFKLTLADSDLVENANVRRWLDDCTARMNTAFLKSNLYNALPIVYGDMGLFGTGCMYVEEDFDGNVFRFQPFQIASYGLAQSYKLQVDTFFRSFRMTARQIIQQFAIKDPSKPQDVDWSMLSQEIKDCYETDKLESWFDVCHIIKPNDDYVQGSKDPKRKRFSSFHYEESKNKSDNAPNKFLREAGYDYFPVLAPRWQINGEDIYGTSSPGMEALGDIKQLQVGEKRSLQAVDKMVNPPLLAPTSMKNSKVLLTPGDITYTDLREGVQGIRSAYDINFRIMELEQKQSEVRNRIRRTFFEDLFLMLASSDRRQITAREIDERHEEKLLALGPVLEQLNQDLLDPLIDIAFTIMQKQGMLPQAPPEIQGQEMKIEYISIMAQAQKMVGLASVDRFAGFAAQVASIDPRSLDKLNTDNLIDVYGDMTSVPSKLIRSDEEAQEIRDKRDQQAQAQAQAESAAQMASAAKDLSQAKTSDENVLSQVLGL